VIYTRMRVLFIIAAATTIIPGILHLNMGITELSHTLSASTNPQQGASFLKSNASSPAPQREPTPGEIASLTPISFTVTGIAQILWAVPLLFRWGRKWYAAGIAGTAALMILWTVTRIPGNPITGRGAPVSFGVYDEIFQAAFIAITCGIMIYASRMKRLDDRTAAEAV